MNVIDIQMPSGNFLEIDSTTIRLKILNNVLSDNAFPAYYSFPASIPNTPKNQIEFGFKHLPEGLNNIDQKIPIKLIIEGKYFDSCLLNINKIQNGIWDVNIISGNQQKLSTSLSKSMRELDFKGFNAFDLDLLNRYVIVYFNFESSTSLDFRLKDPDISSSFDETYTNTMTGTAQEFINAVIEDINTGTGTHSFTASEYKPIQTNMSDYTAWIVLKSDGSWNKTELEIISTNVDLFALHTNLKLTPTTIPDWYYSAPISAHMTAITDEEFYPLYQQWFGVFDYRFPIIYNPQVNGNDSVPPLPIVNWWHFEKKRFEPQYYEMANYFKYNFDAKTACVKLSRVLQAIGDTIGFSINTTLFDNTEMDSLILISNGIIDYLNNTIIDLRLTMPDSSIGDFLTDLKKLFGLALFFDFSSRVIRIERIKDILNSTDYIDFTDKIARNFEIENKTYFEEGVEFQYNFDSNDSFAGENTFPTKGTIKPSVADFASLPSSSNTQFDIRLTEDTNNYYIASINPTNGVTEWVLLGKFFNNYIYGAGKGNITCGITPILEYNQLSQSDYAYPGSPITFEILLPALSQPAKITGQSADENPFTARLAFYRGMQPMGSSGFAYPLATSDIYDFDRNVIGTYTLKLEGVGGIIETHLANFFAFATSSKYFNSLVKLNGNDIISLNSSKALRAESTNYIIDTIDIVFDNKKQSISPSQVYMYKK
jgi:hypothetical protein